MHVHARAARPARSSGRLMWSFDGTVVKIEPTSREETFSDGTFQVTEFVVTLQVRQNLEGRRGRDRPGDDEPQARAVGSTSRWVDDTWCSQAAAAATHGLACRSAASPAPTTAPENLQRSSRLSAAPESGGRVFGSIRLTQRSFKPPHSFDRSPMDLEVRLVGNGRTLATTAKAGRYEFSGLAAGNYGLSVLVPDGYSTWMPTRPVEIPNQRACVESDFSMTPSGRISGWLVDARGRDVSNVEVEATAADIELDREKYLAGRLGTQRRPWLLRAARAAARPIHRGDQPPGPSHAVSAVRPNHLSWRQRATDDDRARTRPERGSWTLDDPGSARP